MALMVLSISTYGIQIRSDPDLDLSFKIQYNHYMKTIANYADLIEVVRAGSLTQTEESILCASLCFGVPLDQQTDDMVTYVTLCNWQNFCQREEPTLLFFYDHYIQDDLQATVKTLPPQSELQTHFANNLHNFQEATPTKIKKWLKAASQTKTWVQEHGTIISQWKQQFLDQRLAEIAKILQSPMLDLPEACLEYIEMYLHPLNDTVNAFNIVKFAANLHCPAAEYLLSEFYQSGIGTAVDETAALKWCQKAAASGNAEAEYALALRYDAQGEHKKALSWYSLASEHQHPEATFILGLAHGSGKFTKKDPKRAIQLFREAIKLGQTDAYYYLGIHYESGQGVKQDFERAVEYFSIAATFGYEPAQKYLSGKHVFTPADYRENPEFADLLKTQDPYALYTEGCYYEALLEHSGANPEHEFAMHDYFQKAAEIWELNAKKDNTEAQFLLGLCYLNGKGLPEDGKQASKWLQTAAENGYQRAFYHIGEMYHLGDNVEMSDRKANHYFITAAENNDADAMQKMGESYEDGYGVPKDLEKALEWYQKSAELGNTCACRCIAHLENQVFHHPERAKFWHIRAAIQGDRNAQVVLAKNALETESALPSDFEQAASYYQFSEYYDDIFEEIKDKLPEPNNKNS